MRRFIGELAFAAGLGATIWLVLHLGWRPIGQALATIGAGGIVLLALAHAPTLLVLGLAWWALTRDGERTGKSSGAGPLTFVWGRVMRDAGGELLPFSQLGGAAVGARAVAIGGASGIAAAASSLLDVFIEQAAKTPYSAAATALLLRLAPGSRLFAPALMVLMVTAGGIALLAFKREWVRTRLKEMASALAQRWPGHGGPDPATIEAEVGQALSPRGRVGLSFALHLVAWCMGAAEAWLALRLLGAPVDLAQALVIDGLFVAVRVFAFSIPAAAGVQEAAYIVLGGLFNVPAPTAVAYSLVRRGRDLVLGAPALLVWQIAERRRRSFTAKAERRATDRA